MAFHSLCISAVYIKFIFKVCHRTDDGYPRPDELLIRIRFLDTLDPKATRKYKRGPTLFVALQLRVNNLFVYPMQLPFSRTHFPSLN